MENSMKIPQKSKNRITILSRNPTPGRLCRENHGSKRSSYSNVHCSTNKIAKTWKQPKCPLTEEWIKKMWYIYTMEHYSAIKRNEITAIEATWMDLEIILLSEVSQTVRHQHQMPSLTCRI